MGWLGPGSATLGYILAVLDAGADGYVGLTMKYPSRLIACQIKPLKKKKEISLFDLQTIML
jgi:hypothetical protein